MSRPRARRLPAALRRTLAIGVLAVVGCAPAASEAPARPHILFLSLDTLRADRLGCYGSPRDTSPHLDALAASGYRFAQAFAHSNATGPSHASLLTGTLPEVHGIYHDAHVALSPAIPTVTERLREAGWRTVAFADGGYVVESLGFDRGFDAFESGLEPFDEKLDRVAAWLGEAGDEPTFLFVHTYGVHAPYVPAPEHDVYTDPSYVGPVRTRMEAIRTRSEQPGDPGMGKLRAWFWHEMAAFTDADRQYLSDLYDGCVRTVDEGVGRLLGLLDEAGWLDDAWVVVVSDHGEAFREHDTFSHHQMYAEELHVPLLVRPPGGLTSGVVVDEVVGLVDVPATLYHLAGLEPPPTVQGRSLLPVEVVRSRAVRSTSNEAKGYHTLTTADLKLHHRTVRDELELYDRARDPGEHADLLPGDDGALDERVAALLEEAARLAAEAAALRARVGDPVPAGALDEEQLETLRALGYVK